VGEVVAVERLDGGIVEISVRLPHLAASARPGEFAQLRCGEGIEPLLRRPFTVAWTDGDLCGFVLEAVGTGTRRLVALRPGDPLRALGPLGNGFSVDPAPDRALIVSGGIGCAPFPLLVSELRRRGCAAITVLNGAATASRLYPPERFSRGGAPLPVVEATDDGSRGHRGPVTELLAGRYDGATTVYACGPNPMLAALAAALTAAPPPPLRAQVSLEAPMGCGFGICLGCTLPVADGAGTAWALCCRQGPVMEASEVAWTALLALPPVHMA
jgi:dihydroorotate dehydrogenase electron transfer subunit